MERKRSTSVSGSLCEVRQSLLRRKYHLIRCLTVHRSRVTLAGTCAVPAARHTTVAEACLRTLGYYALALYAQGGTPAAGPGDVNTDFIYLVTHASLVAKIVLVILLLFSA